MENMNRIIILLLLSSFNLYASDKEIKTLFTTYLDSIHKKDLKQLKSITSKEYYELLEEYLKKAKPQTQKFNPKGFDIVINPARETKNQFWVNIKDKKKKDYSDYWFIVEKKDSKFIIDRKVHTED